MIAFLRRTALIALPVAISSAELHAQAAPTIRVRTLAPSTAVSKDSVGAVLTVRAVSNGNVFVNDLAGRRLLMFDAKLASAKVVVDTAGGNAPGAPAKAAPAGTIIRYLGDSTLYPDRATQTLLVLDANGKVARVMSIPVPADIITLSAGGEAGTAGFDAKGRLVYHGRAVRKPPIMDPDRPWLPGIPVPIDTAPIVRADLDARTIDTLTKLRLNISTPVNKREFDEQGNITLRMYIDLLGVDDQWAFLSDGTVAVLSVQDYHINWVDPDGTKRSTPKMPFDWKRLTDADKQRMKDSLKTQLAEVNGVAPRTISTPNGPRTARQQYEFLPPERFGDYEQPVQTGAVKPDLDARVWILPRTSLGASDGLLYDVINRKGEIVERVRFPKDCALAGFGPNGAVYIVRLNGQKGVLERTTVK